MPPGQLISAKAKEWLLKGGFYTILAPQSPGVSVPADWARVDVMTLHWSTLVCPTLTDLTINQYGVSGTLSFRGSQFWCMVPWSSVVETGPLVLADKPQKPRKPTKLRRVLPAGWLIIEGGKK